MNKTVLIFLAGIFLPSLVLGWLALRTAGEQHLIIEKQAAELYQAETDSTARELKASLETRLNQYAETMRGLLAKRSSSALAENFGSLFRETWHDPGIPFAVSPAGKLTEPKASKTQRPKEVERFVSENSAFLSNTATEQLYGAAKKQDAQPQAAPNALEKISKEKGNKSASSTTRSQESKDKKAETSLAAAAAPAAASADAVSRAKLEDSKFLTQQVNRNIVPQKLTEEPNQPLASKFVPEVSDFRTAVSNGTQGIISRFVQNELEIIFWYRTPDDFIFGLALDGANLREYLQNVFPDVTKASPDTCIAMLDENGKPIEQTLAGFTADWKRPFVATEIGESLPHWEVALYLTDPGRFTASARLFSLTLILFVALSLAAILAGGYFVAADTRRQLALAQKKTDFVSNVSHELKTPLTSIRMFAELLASGRVEDGQKRSRYLRIIMLESERLTRLINNVLDFARMERKSKVYDIRPVDLFPIVERVWQAQEPHLLEAGFAAGWIYDPAPYPVAADPDSIAQILVNLLSNAEKYSNGDKEITFQTSLRNNCLQAAVLDRGPGVPPGMEEKIFDAFQRGDESLASGVQGSGLGLTLARQIARDHGGDVTLSARDGGGSIFTLTLPLKKDA